MKVIVAGAGVIGSSIAWRCAQRGMEVTLVDPTPGRGASWVAGGMLAPVAEAYQGEDALLQLALASSARYPAFVDELDDLCDADAGYMRKGTVVVARDTDDTAELARLHDLHLSLGLSSERLTGREARRLEPALAPDVRGALWIEGDDQIDNRMLVETLAEACERSGVALVRDKATAITRDTVTIAGGDVLHADEVVAATGAWTPPIWVDGSPVELAVRPVKGQILRVRRTSYSVCPSHTIRGIDVYVIPRHHGEIAIGATVEERGFDTTVTAGAVRDLLHEAWTLLPGLAEAQFLEAIAGLRPGTPDNAPLLGRVAGGPIVATGHYRNGILLAPVTADTIADLLANGVVPETIRRFDPHRFDRASASEGVTVEVTP